MKHYEQCCIWLHLWSMLSNTHISSVMDCALWTLLYMVASVEHAFQYSHTQFMDVAFWALLCMVASVEHAFQYSHIQCVGWMAHLEHCCVWLYLWSMLSTTHISWWMSHFEHCCVWLHLWSMLSNTHISSVIYEALWALLYMIISVGHAFQYLHIQCVGWMAHHEHCCVWLHLSSMLSNNRISSVLDGCIIMSSFVYNCISGACFPILTYPVW